MLFIPIVDVYINERNHWFCKIYCSTGLLILFVFFAKGNNLNNVLFYYTDIVHFDYNECFNFFTAVIFYTSSLIYSKRDCKS